MMEVDSWRGEGGFKGGEGGRVGGGGPDTWISRTDCISPIPNTFGDSLKNSKKQQYLSPEFGQRRGNPETRIGSELEKEGGQVTYIAVGDSDDKQGRISGETFNRFGQHQGLACYCWSMY